MNKAIIFKKIKKAIPIALSIGSVIGVFATGVLSATATIKALEKVETQDDAWKCYIPAALTAIATAACIISCGVLNHKRQASLLSAYALLANSYKQYREKTKEICGEDADRKIRQAIRVEQPKKVEVRRSGLITCSTLDWGTDDEEVKHLFYDTYSNRYFESTISKVLQAEINIGNDFSLGGWVCMNDFYDQLGLEHVDGGDEVGWCVCDDLYFIEFDHRRELIEDTIYGDYIEALVIDYVWPPNTEAGWDPCQ